MRKILTVAILLAFAIPTAITATLTSDDPGLGTHEPHYEDDYASAQSEANTGESEVESATGIHYQHDAGVEGDAPGTCETVDDRRILPVGDDGLAAMVVEHDDEADAFVVPLGAETQGHRMSFELIPGLVADLYELKFDIVDANCGFSVFDPDADIYHPERNAPEQPYDARLGYTTHEFDINEYDCGDEWKMHLKHAQGIFPDDIYMEWSNGDYTYLEPGSDPSQVAKFRTTYNTEHTLVRIATQMPITWEGDFRILTGPCDTEDWSVEPPSQDGYSGNFTVVESGEYVLLVTLERGLVDQVLDHKMSMATCHDDGFCFAELGLNYDAFLVNKTAQDDEES